VGHLLISDTAEGAPSVGRGDAPICRSATARNIYDKSIQSLGDSELDCGVNARLIFKLRQMLDSAPTTLSIPSRWFDDAKKYFQNIKIVGSNRLTLFE